MRRLEDVTVAENLVQYADIQALAALSQIMLPSGTLYALSLCVGAD